MENITSEEYLQISTSDDEDLIMNKLVGLLVAYIFTFASVVSQSPKDFTIAVGEGIQKEIAYALKQPVNETLGYMRSSPLMENLTNEEYQLVPASKNGEFNMSKLVELLVTCVTFSSVFCQSPKEFFNAVGEGIQKEIVAVKQPVDETITYVGSSQCANVKKLFGVSYEQLKGEKEPDLNALSLVFKTRAVTAIMNITQAPLSLRQARSFQNDERFIIYIHGFTDDPTKDSFSNISYSFLSKGSTSVIALDGSSLIKWLYIRATSYVQFIGRKLGEVLAAVVYDGISPNNIHIIGHSLGAHISAFAGKTFFNLTGQRVGRISALDPAGPCFTFIDENSRLKSSDAKFVDVIHTDAGVYGIKEAVGHVDYYPNSGSMQPNCLSQSCSHSRAWLYYTESVIREDAFPAVKCKDWEAFRKGQCENTISYMGYPTKPGTTGFYFLQTGGQSPFGLGMNGTKYVNNDGVLTNIGNLLG